MAYQDILATQVADLPHEADLPDFSAGKLAIAKLRARRSGEWVRRVLCLLDEAVSQLQPSEQVAQGAVLEATAMLRKQIESEPAQGAPDADGRLLAWQVRRVREYVDRHITGPVLVADLCALIGRSEAHFSRAFKRTIGESPHAFVLRCRLELAATYMLQTDASLSDIALQCGFTDQPHLCKHFRQSTGQTPGAWRRAHRTKHSVNSVLSASSEGMLPGSGGSVQKRDRLVP
ncbi:MAG TPA: AraC family transcriptional regulator, partial [Steroidobacteraceae bacterium]|nr:AraC family transcriptional regulator [Steroidobacteraceae bacterium]